MNALTIPPKQRDRLAALCGMLGSNHDGERANAAAQASKIVLTNGLTWQGIIAAAFAPKEAFHPDPPQADYGESTVTGLDDFADHSAAARWVLANAATLSDWERDFLHNVQTFSRLSDKQRGVLERLIVVVGDGSS